MDCFFSLWLAPGSGTIGSIWQADWHEKHQASLSQQKIPTSSSIRRAWVSRTDFGLHELPDREGRELLENVRLTPWPLEEVFYKMVPCDNRLFMPSSGSTLYLVLSWAGLVPD